MSQRTTFIFHATVGALTLVLGCGSSGADDGKAGKAFVPDGIVYERLMSDAISPVTSELELVAATYIEAGAMSTWLVAVKNVGQRVLCFPGVVANFLDADQNMWGFVRFGVFAPYYGSALTPCLGPGDIGAGSVMPIVVGTEARPTQRIQYRFEVLSEANGPRDLSAMIEKVVVGDPAGDVRTVKGVVHNYGATDVRNPSVHFFPMDGAGRPLAVGHSLTGNSIQAGADWQFILTVNVPVEAYAAFVTYERL